MRIQVSKHIILKEIGPDIYVGWNKYSPSVLKLNKDALYFLEIIKKSGDFNENKIKNENIKKYIEKLFKYRFLFEGNNDPHKDFFIKDIEKSINKLEKKAEEFCSQKQAYTNLYISNDACNLNCDYCIKKYSNHVHSKRALPVSPQKREEIIFSVIDQYVTRKIEHNLSPINISFNGGEIFLEWKLIKKIIQRNKAKYGDLEFQYFANTNMTLMTPEIAKFMNRNNFKITVSIDGYRDIHNRTRKYHNGNGSFDDVMRGLKIYNNYNKNQQVTSYQGTIEYPDRFKPEEVFKMGQYGLKQCRLAPNLLNVSEEEAIKKADLMARLLKLNAKHDFKVTESYFNNMEKLVNLTGYSFFFNCIGVSGFPAGINLNINKMRLTQLCSFIPYATVPIEDVDYDIYNPNIWETAKSFVVDRTESLKKNCIDCDLVGICRGSCILMGLDNENKVNPAACAYQRILWNRYLDTIIKYEPKPQNRDPDEIEQFCHWEKEIRQP